VIFVETMSFHAMYNGEGTACDTLS